jgi:2-oxo-4-hydroxy-4-carboxy--5-ureidoimidazoline (OHCU) decarboxylase
MLEARLTNDAERELPIAAEEQRKITALRLAKLVDA